MTNLDVLALRVSAHVEAARKLRAKVRLEIDALHPKLARSDDMRADLLALEGALRDAEKISGRIRERARTQHGGRPKNQTMPVVKREAA